MTEFREGFPEAKKEIIDLTNPIAGVEYLKARFGHDRRALAVNYAMALVIMQREMISPSLGDTKLLGRSAAELGEETWQSLIEAYIDSSDASDDLTRLATNILNDEATSQHVFNIAESYLDEIIDSLGLPHENGITDLYDTELLTAFSQRYTNSDSTLEELRFIGTKTRLSGQSRARLRIEAMHSQ